MNLSQPERHHLAALMAEAEQLELHINIAFHRQNTRRDLPPDPEFVELITSAQARVKDARMLLQRILDVSGQKGAPPKLNASHW